MKVSIELDPMHDRSFYTSFDVVCGTVILEISQSARVESVIASLEGGMVTSSPCAARPPSPLDMQPQPASKHYQLFRSAVVLFPPREVSEAAAVGSYTLGSGLHSFRFGIEFPVITSCLRRHANAAHALCPPPPSFRLDAPGLETKTYYVVRTRVKRHGIWARSLLAEKPLYFVPLDPPISSSLTADGLKSVHSLPGERLGLPNAEQTSSAYLPLYTPSLSVEAIVGRQYSGALLDICLSVIAPRRLLQGIGGLWLRLLRIRLQMATTMDTGQDPKVHISRMPMVELATALPVSPGDAEEGTMRLDPQMWSAAKIPDIVPSFSSCAIRRSYALEIITGFTSARRSEMQLVGMTVEVEIRTGNDPPAYD